MKINVNGKAFVVNGIIDDNVETKIYVGKDDEIADLLFDIIGDTVVEVVDEDENIRNSISATYINGRMVETKASKWFEFSKKVMSDNAKVSALMAQITDLELALCEIYESLGV
jgi:hypothetical protein